MTKFIPRKLNFVLLLLVALCSGCQANNDQGGRVHPFP